MGLLRSFSVKRAIKYYSESWKLEGFSFNAGAGWRLAMMKKQMSDRKPKRATFRPRFENLAARLTPTTYTVSSLADSGDNTLRAAIASVNGDTTPDEIDFSVADVN